MALELAQPLTSGRCNEDGFSSVSSRSWHKWLRFSVRSTFWRLGHGLRALKWLWSGDRAVRVSMFSRLKEPFPVSHLHRALKCLLWLGPLNRQRFIIYNRSTVKIEHIDSWKNKNYDGCSSNLSYSEEQVVMESVIHSGTLCELLYSNGLRQLANSTLCKWAVMQCNQ